MKRICILCFVSILLGANAFGQSNNKNYVRTNTILVPGIKDSTQVPSLQVQKNSQAIQYIDGVGRPIQIIAKQNSPGGNDVVQPVVYDAVGREERKYLPFTQGTDGSFKTTINTFYTSPPTTIPADSRPFSHTNFETSPLSRPTSVFEAGNDWYTANKAITFQYVTNVLGTGTNQEKVIAWKILGGMPVRESVISDYTITGGYYENGALQIKSTKDENGYEVREYTDKQGRMVLKKVQATDNATLSDRNHWAQTYYVYDVFGNLRFVLQPVLSQTIHQSDSYNPTTSDLTNFAFQYRYDSRKRMTEKRVPGADWVYMVYDKRDRLVMTQDGNQRAATPKNWTFTKYDALNRPIATGIKDTTTVLTQSQMQSAVDAHYAKTWTSYGESFVGYAAVGNLHGYTNKSYPVSHVGAVPSGNAFLTVTYYDNYDYRNGWTGTNGESYTYVDENLSQPANGVSYNQPDAYNGNVVGQVTGTKVKVLDGVISNIFTWLRTANYYDDNYRVIQIVSDNYKGGVDRVTNLYDFSGKVLKTKSTHSQYDVAWKDAVAAAVSGNKLYRSLTGTGTNQSGAVSRQQLPANTNGWIEVTASETTSANRTIGLAAANPDLGNQTMNYALTFGGTQLYFLENGQPTTYGTFQTGDVYRIERTGTTVKYYKNGTLIRTSPTASSSMLMVDASFYNYGSTLMNVKASFAASTDIITRTFEYDHAGRLLKTYHKINNNDEVLLSQNEYNELGQLVDKDLHSVNGSQPKQSVDHRYNIRGWLTSINNAAVSNDGNTNDDTGDLFGMNLAYNTDVLSGGTAQYNGNIASMTWSKNLGLGTTKENGYNYSYDPMNRITAAALKEKSSGWAVPTASAFSESGYTYDLNGNIKGLTRYDHRGSTAVMDNLTYDYGTGTTQSNKLLKVTDAGDDNAGFKEFNGTGDDYTYDANGNLLWDKNKGGKELLTNGDFVNGNTNWTVSDPGSKLTFSNGSIDVVSGSAASRITQAGIVRTGYPYVVVIDMERTSGGALTITAGNASTYVSATGVSAFNLTPSSSSNFYIDIPANFVGKINKVELKGLVVISYNYLNLVANVTAVNDKQLVYTYDATGRKLSQDLLNLAVASGTTTEKSSHYAGEYFYENDTLKFINTEEGRVIMTGAAPEYQYHLKDHLGNVRLTFTSKEEEDESLATLETANASQEQSKFLYYNEAVKINYDKFDHTNAGGTYYATRLTGGSTNEKYGLTKTLSVMPGDKVSMEVYAKYLDPNSSNWNTALTNFIGSITGGTAPAGTFVDGGSAGSIGGATYPISGINHTSETGTAPKAYLNYIVFNKDMTTVLDMGFKRITTNSREYGQDAAHDKLAFEGSEEVLIKEPGYVYIYISNENETPVEVFFDDFSVVHKKSPVVQMDDYYAFGLTFNSYQRENSLTNQFQYNGKEKQDELDLGWLDYGARMYMPEVGRWTGMDALADFTEVISPYTYAFNNPTFFVDPTGKENIIYLVAAGNMDKKEATEIAALATQILSDLGLATEVRFYDKEELGEFDASKLEATDNWAVVGNDRKEVAKLARSINKQKQPFDDQLDSFSTKDPNKKNPEKANRSGPPNTSKGIVVDHSDALIPNKKRFSAAVSINHGAAHSSRIIQDFDKQDSGDHLGSGIMQSATDFYQDYIEHGQRDLLSKEANGTYIEAMRDRYGTKAAKDNAFSGQVKKAVSNTSKKTN